VTGALDAPNFPIIFSPLAQPTNITTYDGDLALRNNDVLVVKDARFELNGSLLMSGNSTLILDNAVWVPIISPHGNSYTMHGESQLILKRNAQLQSAGISNFRIYDNALINITDSSFEMRIYGYPTSKVQIFNSNVSYVALDSDSRGRSSLFMTNSAGIVGVNGNTEIINSNLTTLAVALDARIVDSSVDSLIVRGGSSSTDGFFGPYVKCQLINSTYRNLDKSDFYNGSVYVEWYLTIAVESSEGKPIEGANVQVFYLNNGSLAAQQTTPSNGKVQFNLSETEITPLGSTYVGEFTVRVSYGKTQVEENVILDTNKQITIPTSTKTDFPLFAMLLILVLIVIALLLILLFRKKVK
jgi:hypothetical protein